jgi:hypothetical protein
MVMLPIVDVILSCIFPNVKTMPAKYELRSSDLVVQEHRSTFYLPYWNLPFAQHLVPRLREFHANLSILDNQLDALIRRAINTQQVDDVEALQVRPHLVALLAVCSLRL